MSTKEERRAALLQRFREVAAERVQTINLSWVKLEQTPDDPAPAAELLRELHTLKGESKAVGLPELGTLAHRLETLLFKVRDQQFRAARSTSEVILRAVDGLQRALNAAPGTATAEVEVLLGQLDAATAHESGAAPTAAPTPSPQAAAPAPSAPTAPGSIRVREERIASISAVTGELLVEQAKSAFAVRRLAERMKQLEKLVGAQSGGEGRGLAKELREELAALDENTYRLGLHVRDLDRTVRELRLVPVASVVEPYARMVRDLAREHDKEAQLKLEGGELEADKRVLEILQEPLLHLLRNCVDHGLELPDDRAARGKQRAGTIHIGVRQEGGVLQLELSDDGRGMDPETIRRKAVQKGLLSDAAASVLAPQQCLELIFLPGFSTRDEASQLSGRGVGMDVVKRRVEQLGGKLALWSEVGQGFRLTMRVPSSISLTRALILSVSGHTVAVPSAAIERVLSLPDTSLFSSHEGIQAELDEGRVPVTGLAPLLGHGGDARSGRIGLLVRSGLERCLLSVDEAGREAELVVKPLGPPLRAHRLLTGAAVLESGQLALVLDVSELFRLRRQTHVEGVTVATRKRTRVGTRVLLVEDSVIFRTTVGGLLKGLGCTVQTAEDGMAGLAALEGSRPDLLVSDVQMPRMDGLEMIRRIRQDSRFARLPIVVLSSLGSAQDRERGADAGANAYLIKGELNEEKLAEVFDRLLS